MSTVVEEGRIAGYRYAILEIKPEGYLWWAERPGGTACWRGNSYPTPTTVEEAKNQIAETLSKYGVGKSH